MRKPLWSITDLIRSKNAGPFELTFDIIFKEDAGFEAGKRSPEFSAAGFGKRYGVDPSEVRVTALDSVRAIKISIPRPVTSGDPADTDVFGGQFHSRLVDIEVDVADDDGGKLPDRQRVGGRVG